MSTIRTRTVYIVIPTDLKEAEIFSSLKRLAARLEYSENYMQSCFKDTDFFQNKMFFVKKCVLEYDR